jgi:hypothetical protein
MPYCRRIAFAGLDVRLDFHTYVFLSRKFEINCGNHHRSLNQVGQSRWILLLREYFSAHGGRVLPTA